MGRIKRLFYKLYVTIVNSSIWFHLYVKHTKKHKKECERTLNRVYDIFLKATGKIHPHDKREVNKI